MFRRKQTHRNTGRTPSYGPSRRVLGKRGLPIWSKQTPSFPYSLPMSTCHTGNFQHPNWFISYWFLYVLCVNTKPNKSFYTHCECSTPCCVCIVLFSIFPCFTVDLEGEKVHLFKISYVGVSQSALESVTQDLVCRVGALV